MDVEMTANARHFTKWLEHVSACSKTDATNNNPAPDRFEAARSRF